MILGGILQKVDRTKSLGIYIRSFQNRNVGRGAHLPDLIWIQVV